MFGCKGRAAAGLPCTDKPLPLCLLVSCAMVSVCGIAVPGNTAHGDAGWAGTGEPCAQFRDVSSSPGYPWPGTPHRQTRLAQSHDRSLARGQLSTCTLGSAASKGAAGARRQQVLLLLLFLRCLLFLPCEPHSHQIHFSQAHQEVSILGDCGGPAERC